MGAHVDGLAALVQHSYEMSCSDRAELSCHVKRTKIQEISVLVDHVTGVHQKMTISIGRVVF